MHIKFAKMKRILAVIILIVMFFPNFSNAALTAEQGLSVASFAQNYINEGNKKGILRYSQTNRQSGYTEKPVNGILYFDCSSFVSYVYKKTLGFKLDSNGWAWTTANFNSQYQKYFIKVQTGTSNLDALIPGDILLSHTSSWQHVVIYTGKQNGKYTYAHASGTKNNLVSGATLRRNQFPVVLRVRDGAFDANKNANTDVTWPDGSNSAYEYTGGIDFSNINYKPVIGTDKFTFQSYTGEAQSDFNYQGIPDMVQAEEGENNDEDDNWLFSSLGDALDWVLGYVTTGIKAFIVGIAMFVEVLITRMVDAGTTNDFEDIESPEKVDLTQNTEENTTTSAPVSNPLIGQETEQDSTQNGDNQTTQSSDGWIQTGSEVTKEYTSISDKKKEIQNRLTIEKIVYNQVPILDVNLFNKDKAAGKDLAQDSVITVIRNSVASWYYVIRQISIIGLLLVLLYLGIRMALSTIASDKAKYKQLLVDWSVSFIIVFCIHYFMVAIMFINEQFLNIFTISRLCR